MNLPSFTHSTKTTLHEVPNEFTEEKDIGEWISQVRKHDRLKHLLIQIFSENHRVYKNRGTNTSIRILGYALASFEHLELPDQGLIFVLDQLQNSRSPYIVASAAKALRTYKKKHTMLVGYLTTALKNIQLIDEPLSFESITPSWPCEKYTTSIAEILKTIECLEGYSKPGIAALENFSHSAGLSSEVKKQVLILIEQIKISATPTQNKCCEITGYQKKPMNSGLTQKLSGLILEDQNGEKTTFEHFFNDGHPSIVAFFYTRCENPGKCSLTISKLGQLQSIVENIPSLQNVKISAITYDPDFDLPAQCKAYGENRNFSFSKKHRFFRAPSDFHLLASHFNLQVNYNNSIVNQHRIELFIVDHRSKVFHEFSRLQWKNEDVIEKLTSATGTKLQRVMRRFCSFTAATASILLPIGVALFPKCPLCWAAYMSLLGVAGLAPLQYNPSLLPILLVFMAANLSVLFLVAKRRNGIEPFLVCVFGTVLILLSSSNTRWLVYAGLFFTLTGSTLNTLSPIHYLKYKSFRKRLVPSLK